MFFSYLFKEVCLIEGTNLIAVVVTTADKNVTMIGNIKFSSLSIDKNLFK